MVRFFDGGFAEKDAVERQAEARGEGDALMRYGNNMAPVDYAPSATEPTRLFAYPFERTKASLVAVSRGPIDAHAGAKLKFLNPATGGPPMNTIGAFAQRLPAGFRTRPYRSTDATVLVCLEGRGELAVADRAFGFGENDVLVVPSWHAFEIRAAADTILFGFSDRPAQQALGLWREQKL
jgi:gentisate 1,2-dioxygenase